MNYFGLLGLGFLSLWLPLQLHAAPRLVVEIGVTADGTMSESWVRAIQNRHEETQWKKLTRSQRLLTPPEKGWIELLTTAASRWLPSTHELEKYFPGISPPSNLRLLLGNQGGDDGFTWSDDTICLDVSAWARAYGAATDEDRVDRILSHEFTHLLTKRWLAKHPFPTGTPLEQAQLELFYEGVGNFHSLSSKWKPVQGRPSPDAKRALKRNVPILLDRMKRLALADASHAKELRKGLSEGPFPEKWGALTIALWLVEEAEKDPQAITHFVQAGPQGIPAFIDRHSALPQRK